MSCAMGRAGTLGMLRRTIYSAGLYQPYMAAALAGAALMAVGFVLFLANIVGTLGWKTVVGLFVPERFAGRDGGVPRPKAQPRLDVQAS